MSESDSENDGCEEEKDFQVSGKTFNMKKNSLNISSMNMIKMVMKLIEVFDHKGRK